MKYVEMYSLPFPYWCCTGHSQRVLPSRQMVDRIRLILNMSFRSALNNPVNVKSKVELFVQLGVLHFRVHFDIVDHLTLLLWIKTYLIYRFVKEIFHMKTRTSPI